jgi:hypothetical protein
VVLECVRANSSLGPISEIGIRVTWSRLLQFRGYRLQEGYFTLFKRGQSDFSAQNLATLQQTRSITMAITNQQAEQNVGAHNDHIMVDMLRRLRRVGPPRLRYLYSRRFRPRPARSVARSARSPRSASSIDLPQSRRRHPSALSAIPSSGRSTMDDLFWPPSQVTEAQLSDPATRIILNTAEMTLISCVVDGGTMYYFGVPACRNRRARR